jgi:cytochrome c oxidase assembly protein subunit 15
MLFPVQSLSAAMAQDFSSKSGWLIRGRWTHPTVAALASVFFLWLVVRAIWTSVHWNNRGLAKLVLAPLAAQYAPGTVDVLALAPVWLQVTHLLGADLLWTALIVLAARLTLEPIESESASQQVRELAR